MAEYSPFKLTDAGLELRSRCDVLGESLQFTKFELGDGSWVYPESVPAMVALDNPRKVQPISQIKRVGSTRYSIKGHIIDEHLPTMGFYIREIGLWAKTLEQDEEVLYGVVYAGTSADYLPASGGSVAFDYLINLEIDTNSPDLIVLTVSNIGSLDRVEFVIHEEAIVDPTKTGDIGKHVTDTQAKKWDDHTNSDHMQPEDAMPTGMIVMWAGLVNNIPAGWFLCDGQNNTPDLRNKFVYGATDAANDAHSVGGSADAVVVSHSHTGATTANGNHYHTQGAINAYIPEHWSGGVSAAQTNTGWGGNHSHGVSINAAGEDGAGKNLPPYIKLAFIMKG